MALDITKLRQRLNELKGNQSVKEALWKPREGENRVRIVPLTGSPDNPFTELYFHNIGGKTYLSPMSFGNPDPIEEFGSALRAEGDLSKEEWKETKKFIPYRRIFVPVIDRKAPENGVKLWAFGKTVYSSLLTTMSDPDYGDITDVKTGRDIKVFFTPQEKSDTKFAKTELTIVPNTSVLTSDAEQLKTWLHEQPKLNEIYTVATYAELEQVLQRFVGQEPSAPVPSAAAPSGWTDAAVAEPSPTLAKSKKKTIADVENEFDSLFQEDK